MNDKKRPEQEIDLECEFSRCFRKLREKKELTQGELAQELGISRQSVNALEKGKSLPSLEVAFDIAHFFETSLDQMLQFSESLEQEFSQMINNRPENYGRRKVKNMYELGPFRPLHDTVSLREAMSRLLEDSAITSDVISNVKTGSLMPAMDMYETGKEVVVEAHIPGMTEKDTNVEVDNDGVYITGERKQEKVEKEKNFYRKETSYGKFSRSLIFPVKVKSDKANAEFKDGILKITIPKMEIKKPKTIKLKISKKA